MGGGMSEESNCKLSISYAFWLTITFLFQWRDKFRQCINTWPTVYNMVNGQCRTWRSLPRLSRTGQTRPPPLLKKKCGSEAKWSMTRRDLTSRLRKRTFTSSIGSLRKRLATAVKPIDRSLFWKGESPEYVCGRSFSHATYKIGSRQTRLCARARACPSLIPSPHLPRSPAYIAKWTRKIMHRNRRRPFAENFLDTFAYPGA